MSKPHDIALAFGSGPSIEEVRKYTRTLIDNFVSSSVNMFPIMFDDKSQNMESLNVDYWCALDESMMPTMRKFHNNQQLLVNAQVTAEEVLKFKDYPYIPFVNTQEPLTQETTEPFLRLYGIFSSIIPMVHYLLLQGFKKIVLFGIDNKLGVDNEWIHFYEARDKSIKTISQLVHIDSQLVDLKQAFNADIYVGSTSTLNFPRIDVETLLNERQLKEV